MNRKAKNRKRLQARYHTQQQGTRHPMSGFHKVTRGTTVVNGRGQCPTCKKREKVRKDGTMTRHGGCVGGLAL